MRVKCICKECMEYGLVGTVLRKEVITIGIDKSVLLDVKWDNGECSAMYEHEIKEIRK